MGKSVQLPPIATSFLINSYIGSTGINESAEPRTEASLPGSCIGVIRLTAGLVGITEPRGGYCPVYGLAFLLLVLGTQIKYDPR